MSRPIKAPATKPELDAQGPRVGRRETAPLCFRPLTAPEGCDLTK